MDCRMGTPFNVKADKDCSLIPNLLKWELVQYAGTRGSDVTPLGWVTLPPWLECIKSQHFNIGYGHCIIYNI